MNIADIDTNTLSVFQMVQDKLAVLPEIDDFAQFRQMWQAFEELNRQSQEGERSEMGGDEFAVLAALALRLQDYENHIRLPLEDAGNNCGGRARLTSSLLERLEVECETVPGIRYLDDYAHLREQLMELRAQQADAEYREDVFAFQAALLIMIQAYEGKIGVPFTQMPPRGL